MRSLLFVPGNSEKKLAKGFASPADAIIVDLEDSVAPADKAEARRVASDFIAANRGDTRALIYVRVNEIGSGLIDDDLAGVMAARPDGVMLPKCAAFPDIGHLSTKLRVHEAEHGIDDGATRIVPLITETGAAVLSAHTYRPHPRLAGLTWGAEDLSASIGARATRDDAGRYTDVFRLARALTLLAAASADVAAIDTVFPDFRNEKGFRNDCVAGERDGFTARMAIHPAQIEIINQIFTPSAEAVEHASAVVSAFREAGGAGVVAIEGKMYDRPHLRSAERLLARAGSLPSTS